VLRLNQGARINESTTSLYGPDDIKGIHPSRPRLGRQQVHQQQHSDSLELLFVGVGNAGGYVIETIFTIFALGFLGIALAIGGVCIMVWMALNED